MIIGISGKIGHGKDVVGIMFRYAIISGGVNNIKWTQELIDGIINSEEPSNSMYNSKITIKKFATKLREIVSILTGYTVKELETSEVKNTKLGEEWIRYEVCEKFYRDEYGKPFMIFHQCDKERYLIETRINWQTSNKFVYDVRTLLQRVGTEAMRDAIHMNVWVNALFVDYRPDPKMIYKEVGGELVPNDEMPNWIITDMRFPNEMEAVKARDGITIRVKRYDTVVMGEHISETALDNATFDYHIDNSGSFDETYNQVLLIYNQLKKDGRIRR